MADGAGSVRTVVGRSLYARAVLIDTGALIALIRSDDPHHDDDIHCLDAIAANRLPLIVTLPTVYEGYSRLLLDVGPRSADILLDQMFGGDVNLIRTAVPDEVEARRLIARYSDLRLTLVDAVNMAVMTRLSIAACFSHDRHYLQAGFIRIPPFHL